jgi:hypothetical protein
MLPKNPLYATGLQKSISTKEGKKKDMVYGTYQLQVSSVTTLSLLKEH